MNHFIKVIQRRQTKTYYREIKDNAAIHGLQLPPLEEVAGSEFAENNVVFSKEDDEKLTQYALRRIAETKVQHGLI